MAHTVGTLHHVAHGTACGIVIPKVMRFNAEYAADKLAMIAPLLGVRTDKMTACEAAIAAATALEVFMKKVGHPMRLRDVGVPESSLNDCAMHAIADTSVFFNARPVASLTDVLALFEEAY